jgi:hypothetical protein
VHQIISPRDTVAGLVILDKIDFRDPQMQDDVLEVRIGVVDTIHYILGHSDAGCWQKLEIGVATKTDREGLRTEGSTDWCFGSME